MFEADGKYGSSDPQIIEAVAELSAGGSVTVHFTNEDITWSEPYPLGPVVA